MTKKESCEARAAELIAPVLEENGFELVDMEYVKEAGNWYLRAYIDKDGGITINDCELVSRYFSDRLDEADFIEESYTMEVSSPGLDRPLKKDKDFQRHLGDEVEVKLFVPITLPMAQGANEAQDTGANAAHQSAGDTLPAAKTGKKKGRRGKAEARKEFTGILQAFDEKTITVEIPEIGETVFEREKVALVRLAFEW